MQKLLSISFEGLPPTVNMMYRGLHGHRYKTKATLNFQAGVVLNLRLAWKNRPPYEGRVALFITFTTADHRRWDVDNRVKALQDCFSKAGVIKDDSQIDELHVERLYGDFNSTQVILYAFEGE